MPIDTSFQMPKSEKKVFELLPDDVYEVKVKDIEKIVSPFKDDDGNEREVFKFTFNIEEAPHQNRLVFKEVAPYAYISKKGPSVLLSIFNATEKRDLTEAEAEQIGSEQVNALIGKQLRVNLGHKTSAAGNEYNVVKGFLPSKLAPVSFESVKSDVPDFLKP